MYYTHSGAQYSVQAVTDSTGNVVERYSYDAYGTRTVEGASNGGRSAIGLTTGFTGRALDEETGLYYFRNRMYSGKDGRFVSRDPMGYVDGMSLYRTYFSPWGIDPFGLATRSCPDTQGVLRGLLGSNRFREQLEGIRTKISQGYPGSDIAKLYSDMSMTAGRTELNSLISTSVGLWVGLFWD